MAIPSNVLGTAAYLGAWLVPWRPAFRARAARSGFAFYVHHRDAIGRHIAKYGTHEPLLTRWIANHLAATPRGIVVDVGANFGWHTVHAARHPNVDMVVAFEPDPFNAWLLDRNLAENKADNVVVDQRAIGSHPEIGRLFRYKRSNFGRHTLVSDHGYGSRNVPVIDLDTALAALGLDRRPIALIKIDVEGYEPAVVAGARKAIAAAAALVVEHSPGVSGAAGLTSEQMLDDLQAAGLTPFALRREGGIYRIHADEILAYSGVIDVVWLRPPDTGREAIQAADEHARGALTLRDIAAQTEGVVTAL